MANRSKNRGGGRYWQARLSDVPTTGSPGVIYEALSTASGQANHWRAVRSRITNLCIQIPDREAAAKLYRELTAIHDRIMYDLSRRQGDRHQ